MSARVAPRGKARAAEARGADAPPAPEAPRAPWRPRVTLRAATAILSLVGVAVAGYLTWVHYAGLEPFCVGGGGGCERVQSSEYAELLGLPVALLGLAGYLALLGSLALPEELSRMVAGFVALTGAAFSLYLTYVEIAEIHAICQWCVVSAVLMVALAGVSVARLSGPSA